MTNEEYCGSAYRNMLRAQMQRQKMIDRFPDKAAGSPAPRRNTNSHHCHGFLGYVGTPIKKQKGYPPRGIDPQCAETVRR